jgi:hypothetical protein
MVEDNPGASSRLRETTLKRFDPKVFQLGYIALETSAIPSFFREPQCNLRLPLRCNDSPMTSPEARVQGFELSRMRSNHAQCGTLGPFFRAA